ncbi:MAG: phasin [Phreatobacter sp.]|uniref:phasin n=1 Tax=Phreatobacter sp. TaxID=1966341 RepID=UPI001A43DAD3|nr:phasin [Phreatobacter sp.]MBL8570372.1 phasin [Phreatobacter sp.]
MVKQASGARTSGDHESGAYEIPLEMREFADKSVEQARRAFDGFVGAAQRTVAAMEDHGDTVQAGAQDIGRKTIAFAESNVAASFAFAQQLVRATDMTEVMKLQSEFLRSQMEAMQAQARELGASLTQGRRSK